MSKREKSDVRSTRAQAAVADRTPANWDITRSVLGLPLLAGVIALARTPSVSWVAFGLKELFLGVLGMLGFSMLLLSLGMSLLDEGQVARLRSLERYVVVILIVDTLGFVSAFAYVQVSHALGLASMVVLAVLASTVATRKSSSAPTWVRLLIALGTELWIGVGSLAWVWIVFPFLLNSVSIHVPHYFSGATGVVTVDSYQYNPFAGGETAVLASASDAGLGHIPEAASRIQLGPEEEISVALLFPKFPSTYREVYVDLEVYSGTRLEEIMEVPYLNPPTR